MSIFLWLLLLFLVYLIVTFWKPLVELYHLNRRCAKMLRSVPGPQSLPVIGCAHLFKWNNVDFTYQLEGWAKKYFREMPFTGMMKVDIGPVPIVFCGAQESIRPILDSNTNITKSSNYDIVSEWIGTGLLISTGQKWFTRRKIITPTFHFNVLQNYQEIFSRQGEVFADMIEKHADTNEEFDLFPYLKRCALDIICETAMGTEMHTQTGGNMEYVSAVQRLGQIIWDYQRFPWLWLKPIWYLTGLGGEFDRLVKKTNDFTRRVIAERKKAIAEDGGINPEEHQGKKLAFLDMLLSYQEASKLTDEDIREEVDTFMFEGHDTTSSGMAFTLWFLGQELKCQRLVHEELDRVFGDSNRLATADDIKQLVYLEKCIKEALRFFPPVPMVARKLTEDTQIGDITLPQGLTVVLVLLAAQHDPREYEFPDDYYPDHFDAEKTAKRNHYSYVPFSAGPRNCIGQKFAILEEKTVLSSILRRYRVIAMHPAPENRAVPEVILKPSRGVVVKLIKRK